MTKRATQTTSDSFRTFRGPLFKKLVENFFLEARRGVHYRLFYFLLLFCTCQPCITPSVPPAKI